MFLLFLACVADNTPSGTTTGPQDLSGYATLDDLAAIQAQMDAQADEIAALQAALDVAGAQQISMACSDEGFTEPTATFAFAEHIHVLQVEICQAGDNGERCIGPDPTGIGLYSSYAYEAAVDGALASVRISCDAVGDTARVSYILTD